MILIIQIIVIIVALVVMAVILGGKQSYASRAWKKLALIALALAMIIAVLFPELLNTLAHTVGVGRGADLLLYILILAFIGYALNNYLHQQKDHDTLVRLARKIAVLEASERYLSQKKSKD